MAYIAGRLEAIQEGSRTALDNSVILLCSSMLNGPHDATQLPVVMLGRGGILAEHVSGGIAPRITCVDQLGVAPDCADEGGRRHVDYPARRGPNAG